MSAEASRINYEEDSVHIPVKVAEKRKRDINPENHHQGLSELMQEDRFWATLAHAMGPLMMGMWIFADGGPWLLGLILTAGIYLYHSNKSEYVRMHARQALFLQLLGTFGWIALILSGVALWVVALMISIVLMLVLVGFILTPLVLVAGPIMFLASFALPLSVILFGTIGAWETWHGREFRYPYLADTLDRYLGRADTQPKNLVIV